MTKRERLRQHIAEVAAWALRNGYADVAAFLQAETQKREADEDFKKPRRKKKVTLYGGRGRPIAIDFFQDDVKRMLNDEKKKG